MQTKRSYDDGCGAALALDVVGERWAILVVRELLLGPKRFTDLRAGLPGVSPNVLTQRLEELEAAGVLLRRKLGPPAPVWVYELTDWGRELEPVIAALGRWGVRAPGFARGLPVSGDALMVSLRTMFDPTLARELSGEVELRMSDDTFVARLARGRMRLERGASAAPAAALEAPPAILGALIYGGRKLTEALQAGEVRVEGDRALLRRFLACFPLPGRAAG